MLARHFVDRFCRDLTRAPLLLSPAALDDLRVYPWPGNVRELQNLCDGDTIHPRDLNLSFRPATAEPAPSTPWDQIDLSGAMADAVRRVSAEVERRKVEQAIKEAGGDRQRAAAALRIGYKTLVQKAKEYGIADS